MTPTKSEIERHAQELYVQHCYRSGHPELAETLPTRSELSESGFIAQAQSMLMRGTFRLEVEGELIDFPEHFSVDLEELFQGNGLILGSRHTGKSDVAMLISERAMKDKAIVVCFDPSLDWITRSSISRVMKVNAYMNLEVPTESTIFDVSLLSPLEQQKSVERFSKLLFESQAKQENKSQYLIIFEEAHMYFYQGSMRSKAMENTVRLLSVGRNVDIACVLISQFAAMLDKFAIKHAMNQSWFGFTKEPNDLKYLVRILGDDVEKLRSLEDGQFVFMNRNGLGKIQIEPYENNTPKTKIMPSVPELKPIEPSKPSHNLNALTSFGIAVLWFLAVLLAVTQI